MDLNICTKWALLIEILSLRTFYWIVISDLRLLTSDFLLHSIEVFSTPNWVLKVIWLQKSGPKITRVNKLIYLLLELSYLSCIVEVLLFKKQDLLIHTTKSFLLRIIQFSGGHMQRENQKDFTATNSRILSTKCFVPNPNKD
jgi:hypothetical protein